MVEQSTQVRLSFPQVRAKLANAAYTTLTAPQMYEQLCALGVSYPRYYQGASRRRLALKLAWALLPGDGKVKANAAAD